MEPARSISQSLFAVPQGSLGFPKPLTEEFKPARIAEFCGLEKQKHILTSLVKSPRPCGLLFKGTPGSGKTSMAYAFASELNADIWHIGSQECNKESLQTIVARCHYVPSAGLAAFHVVIVDEADVMSDAAQKYLLSKLDGTEPCPNTIWIFTCNSTEQFEERFLSRLIQLPKFNGYGSSDSVRELLARIWRERANGASEPDYSRVPTSNVRDALQWLEVELLAA